MSDVFSLMEEEVDAGKFDTVNKEGATTAQQNPPGPLSPATIHHLPSLPPSLVPHRNIQSGYAEGTETTSTS